jgi:hypothetical protein
MLPPVPALPTARFPTFKAFVTLPGPEQRWPCGDDRPWRWVDAARAAASVAHALGAFGVVSASVADLEDEALAWWLSIFGTDKWLTESRRAMLLAERLDQQPAGFALDSRAFGFDQGAWALTDGNLVRNLNAWCRTALTPFYAAPEDPAQLKLSIPEPEDPPPPAPGDPRVPDPDIPPPPKDFAGTEGRWQVVWRIYIKRVEEVRAKHGRPPKRYEDNEWYSDAGITREEMRPARVAWRERNFPSAC